MKNQLLISADYKGFVDRASAGDVEHYRAQASNMHIGTLCPAVVYKGRVIPPGEMGARELPA